MSFVLNTPYRLCISGVIILSLAVLSYAEENEAESGSAGVLSLVDRIPSPKATLDSAISWTDQHFFHQWRIQQHVDTGQCRLMDDGSDVHATGDFEQCLSKLESIKREQNLAPMKGDAVVLLHGLAAPCWSMNLLARHLQRQGGFETFSVDYASTRSTIDSQARSLSRVIRSLEGIDRISLVGHSMGNIVIRRYLAGDDSPSDGWKPDPRIFRVVMIAPPNHGSIAATRLSENGLFKKFFGQSGRQLGANWENLEPRLATPPVEFGIIAGGFGNSVGLNPFLPGDDDGRIRVETTRLAGASDFIVVSAVHEFIANDPRVFGHTLQFLKNGHFVSASQKRGIPHGPVARRPKSIRR